MKEIQLIFYGNFSVINCYQPVSKAIQLPHCLWNEIHTAAAGSLCNQVS